MSFGKNLQYLRQLSKNMNGLERVDNGVIPCFETDGESMDVYIACK